MSSSASSAAAETSCVKAMQGYLTRILRPKDKTKEINGMKCLLLDKDTKGMVSLIYSMGEILSKEIYLVEVLDAQHESLGHLKAICLLRPTQANIRELVRHLKEPKFLEYHVFFTNILPQDMLRTLADADHLQVVKQVQELYADYFAMAPDLFSVNLSGSLGLSRSKEHYLQADDQNLKRCSSALIAVMLSFKIKPFVRYLASSHAASAVAHEVQGIIGGERELFTFSKAGGSSPLLLILDRREDPLTPLLTKWTYQAMIHEMIPGGIKNNVVDMKNVKGVSKDLEEIVLSPQDDLFFRDYLNAKFPDALEAAQRLSAEYQRVKGSISTGRSMDEIQKALDSMPEVNRKGFLASKHIALLTELNSAIEKRGLLSLGRLEQELSSGDENANEHLKEVLMTLQEGLNVSDPNEPPRRVPLDPFDALRLSMLACIRYEKSRPDKIVEVKRALGSLLDSAGHRDMLLMVDDLLRYAGASTRTSDLYGKDAAGGFILSKLSSLARAGMGGMDDIMPALTRHKPLIVDLLDQLARGKLRKDSAGGNQQGGPQKDAYPYVHGTEPTPGPGGSAPRFSTVIVFVIGGVTYEEAAAVAAINAGQMALGAASSGGVGAGATGATAPFKIILGGSTIHNAHSFLAELQRFSGGGSGGGGGTVNVDMGAGVDLR